MRPVANEEKFTGYSYQAKRQPLVKPLLAYNTLLFSSLPPKGKCFCIGFRVILFLTTAPIFYPLLSLMALIGLPFTKKVTFIIDDQNHTTPTPTPYNSTSSSPITSSGGNSPRDDIQTPSPKRFSVHDLQKRLNNCLNHAGEHLKTIINFEECRQFGCIFELNVRGIESSISYSDLFLLKPHHTALKLIRGDCESRIQDIVQWLQSQNLTIALIDLTQPIIFKARLLIESREYEHHRFDVYFKLLSCEQRKKTHFSSVEEIPLEDFLGIEQLTEGYDLPCRLELDGDGFLRSRR